MWLAARARGNTLPAALLILAALALIGLLPLEAGLRYVVILSMCWGIAAVGLDVFSGYLGQANFGQFAFVGIGAYAITALRSEAHLGVLPSLVITLALVAALSAVIGTAMVQLRHFGAVLTTFFFAFVLYNVLGGNALDPITHSETGLQVPPLSAGPLDLSANGPWLYWLAWAMLLVAVVLCSNYANSRAGRALRLLKQSEPVAGTLGVRVRLTKLWAFVFSAMLAAAAGLPLSLAYGYLAPETFDPSQSITLFAMLVVGGIGSLAGPLIGALIFTALPQLMQGAGPAEALIFALIFLVFLVVLPDGIFGLIDTGWQRALPILPSWLQRRSTLAGERLERGSIDPVGTERRRPTPTPPSQEHVLAVEDVSMAFGGVRALDGVSFRVRAGTIHALVGPNGAGKTTLLNCASGLLRPTSGRILVDRSTSAAAQPTSSALAASLGPSRTPRWCRISPSLRTWPSASTGASAGASSVTWPGAGRRDDARRWSPAWRRRRWSR